MQTDQDAFAQLINDVKPLKHPRDKIVKPNKTRLDNASKARRRLAAVNSLSDTGVPMVPIQPEQYIEYCHARFNKQHFRRLRQGAYPCHYTLDLHGLTVNQAQQTVLKAVHTHGGCILIIHGKGKHQANEKAPYQDENRHLKSHVNYWLQQLPKVLAFCSATSKHGGTGAVYVWLGSPDLT